MCRKSLGHDSPHCGESFHYHLAVDGYHDVSLLSLFHAEIIEAIDGYHIVSLLYLFHAEIIEGRQIRVCVGPSLRPVRARPRRVHYGEFV